MDQFDLPKAQTKRGGGGNRGRGRHSSSTHRGAREEGGSHLESNDYRYEDSDEDSDVDSQPQQQQRQPIQGKKLTAGTDQGPAPGPALRAAAQRKSRGADFGLLLQEADLQYSQSYHRHVEFLSDDLLPLPADLLPFLSTKDPDQELELDLPALAASLAYLPLSTLIRCHPQYVTSELATSASVSTGNQSHVTQQAVTPSVTSQQAPFQLPHAPSSTAPSPSAPGKSHPEHTQASASSEPAHPIEDRPGIASSHATRMQAHASIPEPEKVSDAKSSPRVINLAAASAATGSSSVAAVSEQDPLSDDEDEGTEELLNLLGCGVVLTPAAHSECTGTSVEVLQSGRSGSSSFGVPMRTAGLPARSSSSSYTPAFASAGSAATPPSVQPLSAVKQAIPSAPLPPKPAVVHDLPFPVATSPSLKPQQPIASTPQALEQQPPSAGPQMSPPSNVLPRQLNPTVRAQQFQPQQQQPQQPSIESPPPQRHVDLELEALLGMGTLQAPLQRQQPSNASPAYSTSSGSGKSMVSPLSSGASPSLPVTNPQPMQASLRPVPSPGNSYASNPAPRKTSTTPAAAKGTVKSFAAPTPNFDDWLDSM